MVKTDTNLNKFGEEQENKLDGRVPPVEHHVGGRGGTPAGWLGNRRLGDGCWGGEAQSPALARRWATAREASMSWPGKARHDLLEPLLEVRGIGPHGYHHGGLRCLDRRWCKGRRRARERRRSAAWSRSMCAQSSRSRWCSSFRADARSRGGGRAPERELVAAVAALEEREQESRVSIGAAAYIWRKRVHSHQIVNGP